MGPLVTKPHLDKVRGYIDAGSRRVQDCSSTAVASNAGLRGRLLHRRVAVDRVTPNMKIYKEDLWARPVCRPSSGLRHRCTNDQRARIRQRHIDLHPRWRCGLGNLLTNQDRYGRNQRSDPPCRWHSILSADGKPRSLATNTCTARRASLLYKVEDDHEPLADRHSSWCRIRKCRPCPDRSDWLAAHPRSGHGSQNAATNRSVLNKSSLASASPWPTGTTVTSLSHTENDDATFVLRSNSRAFGKADRNDMDATHEILVKSFTYPSATAINRQRACAIQNDRGYGSRYVRTPTSGPQVTTRPRSRAMKQAFYNRWWRSWRLRAAVAPATFSSLRNEQRTRMVVGLDALNPHRRVYSYTHLRPWPREALDARTQRVRERVPIETQIVSSRFNLASSHEIRCRFL